MFSPSTGGGGYSASNSSSASQRANFGFDFGGLGALNIGKKTKADDYVKIAMVGALTATAITALIVFTKRK